jgi:hypothetical protein
LFSELIAQVELLQSENPVPEMFPNLKLLYTPSGKFQTQSQLKHRYHQKYCMKLPSGYVYKHKGIPCLDLGPIPKISHQDYTNLPKSEKKKNPKAEILLKHF